MVAKRSIAGNHKLSSCAPHAFWCKTFVHFGGFANDENSFARSDGACGGLRVAGWRRNDCRTEGRNCGENEGCAEVRRIFQSVLGREGREVMAGDRQVGYRIFVSERAAGGRGFERHRARSRAAERAATHCAVRTERTEGAAGTGEFGFSRGKQ